MNYLEVLTRQAKTLIKCLQAESHVKLSPAQALDVVAQLNGKRNWALVLNTANREGLTIEQRLIRDSLQSTDSAEGLSDKSIVLASGVCEALMLMAQAHSGTRLQRLIRQSLAVVTEVQQAIRDALLIDEPYTKDSLVIPNVTHKAIKRLLMAQVNNRTLNSWADIGEAVEQLRISLYKVEALLLTQRFGEIQTIMILDSLHGKPISIGLPKGIAVAEAQGLIDSLITQLHFKEVEAPDNLFRFNKYELLVVLADNGFIIFPDTKLGPIWD